MAKELTIGKGVRITESDDMGIFIHFESRSGNKTGQFLGNTNHTPGHRWAEELLADQPERNDEDVLEIYPTD
jgi:hypothetical protein